MVRSEKSINIIFYCGKMARKSFVCLKMRLNHERQPLQGTHQLFKYLLFKFKKETACVDYPILYDQCTCKFHAYRFEH